jgi:hypothetical protein
MKPNTSKYPAANIKSSKHATTPKGVVGKPTPFANAKARDLKK